MRKNQWFASVVLSVLIATSGAAYAHDGNGDPDGGKPWQHKEDCGKSHLTDAQRNLLHETMKKTFEQDKAAFTKMHDLHKKLHDIVAAPNFDAKAFESVTAQIRETHDKIEKDRVHAFVSIAGQFTPQEREMIIRKAHEHHMMHHYGHHHGDHHDGQHADWHGGPPPGGPDGNGWQGEHRDWQQQRGQWQQSQPNDDVTTGMNTQNNDYPPYKTGR